MDVVTLLAQEHETVLAYINKGTRDFTFEQKVIYAAPHPNWGSFGIELLAGGSDVDEKTLPALVWLEQTKPGVFARHTIAMGFPRHATLDVGDIDDDGDIDIVAGYFSVDKPANAWVDVWVNQRSVAAAHDGRRVAGTP